MLMPHVQLRDKLDGDLEALCVSVFSALLGEVECRNWSWNVPGHDNGDESPPLTFLEIVLAMYVSLTNKVSPSGLLRFYCSFPPLLTVLVCLGLKEMDVRLGRIVKRLAASDFEHLLSFIAASLSDGDARWTAPGSRTRLESRLSQLVDVSSLLLRDHPTRMFFCLIDPWWILLPFSMQIRCLASNGLWAGALDCSTTILFMWKVTRR